MSAVVGHWVTDTEIGIETADGTIHRWRKSDIDAELTRLGRDKELARSALEDKIRTSINDGKSSTLVLSVDFDESDGTPRSLEFDWAGLGSR